MTNDEGRGVIPGPFWYNTGHGEDRDIVLLV